MELKFSGQLETPEIKLPKEEQKGEAAVHKKEEPKAKTETDTAKYDEKPADGLPIFIESAKLFYGRNLKTDIKPIESALEKVLTLNGVTYEWRVKEFPQMNFDNKRHVGVLAQEVEAVLPEAVETGEDGYKSVKYSEITPLLIEAMKEQQQIINNQQKQIDELKKMVEELLKK